MHINVKSKLEVIDLSHQMENGMPNFASAPEYRFIPNYRLGDFELADGYWGCNESVTMSGHSGTHIDALGHVAQSGKVYGGMSAADAQSGVQGLIEHSIDDVAPIFKRGVLIDVATHLGVEVMTAGMPIGVELIEECLASAGVEIQRDDCVLVRTGWDLHWGQPETYLGVGSGLPGITVDALTWLADRGAHLVGSDTGVVEVTKPGMEELPVHMEALVQRGVYLLENAALTGLVGKATEFLFVASPLRLRGSSGSPVRPMAVLPGD